MKIYNEVKRLTKTLKNNKLLTMMIILCQPQIEVKHNPLKLNFEETSHNPKNYASLRFPQFSASHARYVFSSTPMQQQQQRRTTESSGRVIFYSHRPRVDNRGAKETHAILARPPSGSFTPTNFPGVCRVFK